VAGVLESISTTDGRLGVVRILLSATLTYTSSQYFWFTKSGENARTQGFYMSTNTEYYIYVSYLTSNTEYIAKVITSPQTVTFYELPVSGQGNINCAIFISSA
jgi:hypothetical protein